MVTGVGDNAAVDDDAGGDAEAGYDVVELELVAPVMLKNWVAIVFGPQNSKVSTRQGHSHSQKMLPDSESMKNSSEVIVQLKW